MEKIPLHTMYGKMAIASHKDKINIDTSKMNSKQYSNTECKELLNSVYGRKGVRDELNTLRTLVKLQAICDILEKNIKWNIGGFKRWMIL